jgi:hypothetical protein
MPCHRDKDGREWRIKMNTQRKTDYWMPKPVRTAGMRAKTDPPLEPMPMERKGFFARWFK